MPGFLFNARLCCVSRLAHGVVHRLARVFPDEAIRYKDFEIPVNVR